MPSIFNYASGVVQVGCPTVQRRCRQWSVRNHQLRKFEIEVDQPMTGCVLHVLPVARHFTAMLHPPIACLELKWRHVFGERLFPPSKREFVEVSNQYPDHGWIGQMWFDLLRPMSCDVIVFHFSVIPWQSHYSVVITTRQQNNETGIHIRYDWQVGRFYYEREIYTRMWSYELFDQQELSGACTYYSTVHVLTNLPKPQNP